MQETLINLETAKLAAEKGFDIQTKAFHARLDQKVVYMMPTQALLQKWLREIKDLHISLSPIITNDPNMTLWGYEIISIGTATYLSDIDSADLYYSYEEALEHALTKCLTKIKND